ncbi:MAG: flagellin lysine-N-methylase [Clostridia bacterium]|nr:flagellin lysine-N-methylase [Clostridia bacterium]
MKETHVYLTPDYYPDFACKMGSCRAACCEGWPISFSLEDYYHLVSAECSEEMRTRLDKGLRIKLQPTPDAYAEILPRYDGNCPMRLEDGRCALHAELGEQALSHVCRLYPRGVRLERGYECSCSNSCEAVLELLFSRDEPIEFVQRELTFDLPKPAGPRIVFETLGREQEIRLWLIRQMQNQALPMPQRLMAMGHALLALDEALETKDAHQIDRLLKGQRRIRPLHPNELTQGHLDFGLKIARGMIELLDERSVSIRRYGETALACFDGSFERYEAAREHFETLLPKWEIWFEHMLVNHMFFSRFPFQDRPESLKDEFIALCGVYALLRFLGIGWLRGKENAEAFVDVAAAAFRLVDHTSFDRYAAHMMKRLGCGDLERVHDLVSL